MKVSSKAENGPDFIWSGKLTKHQTINAVESQTQNPPLPKSCARTYWAIGTRAILIWSESKGTSRQRSGKGAIRKRFPLQKPEVGKNQTNNQVPIPWKHFVSRMSSYFPNRWPISYLNLTKNMITYIRRQQHKNIKHQDIKQICRRPLQNPQRCVEICRWVW